MLKKIAVALMAIGFLLAGGPAMAKAIKWSQLTTAEKTTYNKCLSNTCKNIVLRKAGKRLAKLQQSRKQVAKNPVDKPEVSKSGNKRNFVNFAKKGKDRKVMKDNLTEAEVKQALKNIGYEDYKW